MSFAFNGRKIAGAPGPNKVTANTATDMSGVLIGDGSAVTSKALDTSSLSDDNNHIPTSGAVKSAVSDAKNLSMVATYEPTYGAKVKPITEGVDGLRVSVLSNGSKRLRGCIYVNPALTAGDVVFTLPSALQYHWQQNGGMQAWLQFTGINTNITFCALLSFLDATVWGNTSAIPVGQYVLSEMEYF